MVATNPVGRGALAVWTDVEPGTEDDFHAWYDRQHLAERTGIPGFLNGRRYVALEGVPAWLAWYETTTPDVLAGADYAARHARPTAWTRRVMPTFRNVTRLVAVVEAGDGAGIGGVVLTCRFRPGPGAEPALRALVAERLMPSWRDARAVVGMRLLVPAAADAGAASAEAAMRHEPERPAPWAVIVEATRMDALAVVRQGLRPGALAVAGAVASSVEVGVYDLLYALGEAPFDPVGPDDARA